MCGLSLQSYLVKNLLYFFYKKKKIESTGAEKWLGYNTSGYCCEHLPFIEKTKVDLSG